MKKLPPLIKLEDFDFIKITKIFKVPKGRLYQLPRIAFIGYFRKLSITCQRDICKFLGFEYFKEIPLAAYESGQLQIISTKWGDITKAYTKLVIIGNAFEDAPYGEFEVLLDKKYKNDKLPAIYEYNIPLMMEEELWKLHVDYPNVSNSSRWEPEYMIPIEALRK